VCVCVWQITDLPVKTALIETLSTVTAGKIYVEVERARLVRQLAKIKEAAGDIDAAAEAMQEVAVRPRRPRQASGAVCMCVRVSTLLCSCSSTCLVRRLVSHFTGGDVWCDGQDGEGGVHSGTSAAVPGQKGLRARLDPLQES
jgi:hypothetical protein